MKTLPAEELRKLGTMRNVLDNEFEPWRAVYRDLADFLLPLRYSWVHETMSASLVRDMRTKNIRNKKILDATGTKALRDLAAGMLNGVASPAREWFSTRFTTFFPDGKTPVELQRWLEETRRRMLLVLAQSNFYNSFAIMLLELGCFGTSAMLVYEDFEDVVRFYNVPAGDFRIQHDERRDVSLFSRTEVMTVEQLVLRFGIENVLPQTRTRYEKGGADLLHGVVVGHVIELNREDGRFLPGGAPYREFYWEVRGPNPKNQVLEKAIFSERPGGFPRWELLGNEPYGVSPAMDALPDVIQLQHETLRKAEALDKMTNPPIVQDAALRNQGGRLDAGAKFNVPSFSSIGARPVYQPNLNLGELTADIRDVQQRIRDAFFNDLFRMISQLQTVRSATEIDARQQEKLVLMGAVLERLENEAIDPIMYRVFKIMQRKGLIPELPEGFGELEMEIQYVSILSDAQRAAGVGVIERFMGQAGNLAAVVPDILDVVDWHEIFREYGARLSVPANGVRPREQTEALIAQRKQQIAAQQEALVGTQLTQAAKNLSETEVGGGQNAFQSILGGV